MSAIFKAFSSFSQCINKTNLSRMLYLTQLGHVAEKRWNYNTRGYWEAHKCHNDIKNRKGRIRQQKIILGKANETWLLLYQICTFGEEMGVTPHVLKEAIDAHGDPESPSYNTVLSTKALCDILEDTVFSQSLVPYFDKEMVLAKTLLDIHKDVVDWRVKEEKSFMRVKEEYEEKVHATLIFPDHMTDASTLLYNIKKFI